MMGKKSLIIFVSVFLNVQILLGCRNKGTPSKASIKADLKRKGFPKTEPLHTSQQIILLNSPVDRFTATHGISASAGQHQYFEVLITHNKMNYFEVTANIARGKGSDGGPEKFEIYMSRDFLPTQDEFDMRSEVSVTSSYIAKNLYSKTIHVDSPPIGRYYILLVANEDFKDLLITTITDYKR